MNQTVIENRHKIDTACQLCFYKIDEYYKAVSAFNADKHRIAALVQYSEQEKERQVKVAMESLQNTVQSYYAEIKSNLDKIRVAATEMESLLDIGEDLQNAISVVKALGKALPVESRLKIVELFKGQRQALVLLKAAYAAADITDKPYFEGLIIDIASELDTLEDKAYRLTIQPGTDTIVAVNFGSALEKFATTMGCELTKKFRDIVDTTAAMNAQIRAAAGLA